MSAAISTITTPREHGLIFTGPSINAIYDCTKVNTSRVVHPQPSSGVRRSVFVPSGLEDGHGREIKERFRPGDRIWVKETVIVRQVVGYVAKGCYVSEEWERQISAMFMPRWACRLVLEITDVTLKRLQDLTEIELVNEGVISDHGFYRHYQIGPVRTTRTEAFSHGWDKINGKRKGEAYAWDADPWIWSIKFKRFDQMVEP